MSLSDLEQCLCCHRKDCSTCGFIGLKTEDVKQAVGELKNKLSESDWNIDDLRDWNKPSSEEMVEKLINSVFGEKLI